MVHRFYVDCPIVTDEALLAGDEARHLVKSLRGRVGAVVTLFDGGGSEFTSRVREIARSSVRLDVLDRHEVDRELPLVLTLGVALPKGDRQRWLVEKAVELGVTRLAPLRTARGVAQPVDRAVERLRRTVIEASKQCGRNRLMEVLAPQELGDYLAGPSGEAARWIAHPGAAAPDLSAGDAPRASDAPHPVYLAVGPEGGFTPEEVELARAAGWRPVGFGPRTLRIETASVALAAFVAIGLWGRAGTGAR